MKYRLKQILGDLPYVVEAYWYLRQRGKPTGGFSLKQVEAVLPVWRAQAEQHLEKSPPQDPGKKVFIFSTLRYWMEHAAISACALAGLGHQVTYSFLPYANWHKPLTRFDMRRQNAYILNTFQKLKPFVNVISLFDVPTKQVEIPAELFEALSNTALQDTQYTRQVEDINRDGKLYHLRMERNLHAAKAAIHYLSQNRPDVVILPSGSIVEFAPVYFAARSLDIPVVSYEFSEQRQRVWLGRNSQVMRQNTDELWTAYKNIPLNQEQWDKIRTLFAARQNASLWENFSRRWQGTPSSGGQKVRSTLGLDDRPIVLLAANVVGDSLTLGRQVFTNNMTEWLIKTVQEFAQRPGIQFIIRIHPGERYTSGPSVAEIVHQALASSTTTPENIHIIQADDPVNTYDLIEIANIGLVYTTTVGLEMALSGVPAIVIGRTHYRERGFTLDPNSWEEYAHILSDLLENPGQFRLSQSQVEMAWCYAYHFFFDYPLPYPWHLWHFWNDVEEWPVERVLSEDGLRQFGQTFKYLTGEPRSYE